MMRHALYLAAALVIAATAAARAEPVFPKTSGIGLDPPKGMAVADGFLGFQKGQASIVIMEMPVAAYAQINPARDRFAAKFADAKIADFSAGGAPGFIVRGKQTAEGRSYRKWAVVLGGASQTAMVTVQVPVGDKSVSDDAVEAALRTIALRAPPDLPEQIKALPFTVGDMAGFRPVLTSLGAVLGLTEGPKDVDPQSEQPSVIVSTSLQNPPPDKDRIAYATTVLNGINAIAVDEVTSTRLFEAEGAQWAKIKAKGKRRKTDNPIGILFFVRFGQGEAITVIATAPAASYDRYADRFLTVATSVKPKT